MRIFTYWAQIQRQLELPDMRETVQVYGGSDRSLAEAERDAERRFQGVLERIRTGVRRGEDYEADIREEILQLIDADNVVTRNRYGARVLNSADVMIVDIDRAPSSWRDWFGFGRRARDSKQRIIEHVNGVAQKPVHRDLGFRLYETPAGIRAIVTGRAFAPKSREGDALMRELGADGLYRMLCRRQNCFRARLTPKPHRVQCRRHHVIYPRPDADAQQAFATWLAEYEAKSRGHAACRLVCVVGREDSNATIDYHDRASGALSGLPLA